MKYSKEELNAELGTIIKENVTQAELNDTLSWKKWRIVEHKTISDGTCKVEYSVDCIEASLVDTTWVDVLLFLLSGFYRTTPIEFDLKWKRCRESKLEPCIIEPVLKFTTLKLANNFIKETIRKHTPVVKTSKIVSIQPDKPNRNYYERYFNT